jgi:hypothetical protein
VDEIGWVIERGDSEPSAPTYWAGLDDRWSQDHMDAIRFARKRDAERISARMRYPNNRVCEHMWCDPPAALAPRATVAGWQTMESAPENETVLFSGNAAGQCSVGRMLHRQERLNGDVWPCWWGGAWVDGIRRDPTTWPTHWQPLPASPLPEGER